jgi:hypothetical protein
VTASSEEVRERLRALDVLILAPPLVIEEDVLDTGSTR